jgi:predicted O-linked N-acetylglucosamine transferase (SPINDLY family)
LWVGVRLVTKAGRGFPARVGASLLNAVGLGELVTTSERDYFELALALARDPQKLAAIRARLQSSRTTAPLFDSAQFTRHFEAGLDLAYQRYLEGQAPADIVVQA